MLTVKNALVKSVCYVAECAVFGLHIYSKIQAAVDTVDGCQRRFFFYRNMMLFCVTKYNFNVRLIVLERACVFAGGECTAALNTGQISTSHIQSCVV